MCQNQKKIQETIKLIGWKVFSNCTIYMANLFMYARQPRLHSCICVCVCVLYACSCVYEYAYMQALIYLGACVCTQVYNHVCAHACGDLRLLWVSSSLVLPFLYWGVVSQSNPELLGAAFPASSRSSIMTEDFYAQTEKNCKHIHGKTCMRNLKEALFLKDRKSVKWPNYPSFDG